MYIFLYEYIYIHIYTYIYIYVYVYIYIYIYIHIYIYIYIFIYLYIYIQIYMNTRAVGGRESRGGHGATAHPATHARAATGDNRLINLYVDISLSVSLYRS